MRTSCREDTTKVNYYLFPLLQFFFLNLNIKLVVLPSLHRCCICCVFVAQVYWRIFCTYYFVSPKKMVQFHLFVKYFYTWIPILPLCKYLYACICIGRYRKTIKNEDGICIPSFQFFILSGSRMVNHSCFLCHLLFVYT